MAGLYLHIPFCKQACHYCDFHFSTGSRHIGEMLEAMKKELILRKGFLPTTPETVYFGGGTPSLLSPDQIGSLLDHVATHFGIQPDAEITLEANPDDLRPDNLRNFREAGINRLSIGIQSFHDEILRYLNRAHDAQAARRSIEDSRQAGFDNISIDLIYAIPGQPLPAWTANLERAASFRPEHLSAYALTIEPRTVFGHHQRNGSLPRVSEEIAAEQFEHLQDVLGRHGYDHYEISNFSLPGLHSRHNTSYWLQKPYLGIGPSAHSYDGAQRHMNIANNARYVEALRQDRIPAEIEELTPANKVNEYILTRLRTRWGLDLRVLRTDWGDDLAVRCATTLQRYVDMGLLTISDLEVKLTRKGMLLADQITEDLLIG